MGDGAVRSYWEKNERKADGFAKRGKMACIVDTRNGGLSGNGSFNEPQLLFQDVELGEYIHSATGQIKAAPGSSSTSCDSPRCGSYAGQDSTADDEVWVNYQETYNIVGLNIDTKEIKILRTRVAPFYMNRELPSPQSESSPLISGVENLVRQCNDLAVQNANSVAGHPLLGADQSTSTLAQYSVLPAIGFRLVAGAQLDSWQGHGNYVSEPIQFCEVMPDLKSPSAGLNLAYSAISSTSGRTIRGLGSCGVKLDGGVEFSGSALGTVLDQFIAPGSWDGSNSRHSSVSLSGGTEFAARPVHREQVLGEAKL